MVAGVGRGSHYCSLGQLCTTAALPTTHQHTLVPGDTASRGRAGIHNAELDLMLYLGMAMSL